MNAFTIPTKSLMRGERKPLRGDHNTSKHWRNIPVVGAKQGQKDSDARRRMIKSAI